MFLHRTSQAFSLIELVIVLVLIAILAAVAIPRFHSMTDNAEESSIRGTLGNVRSAISLWHSNMLANGVDAYPPYAAFPSNALSTDLAENPWAAGGASNTVRNGDGAPALTLGEIDSTTGWVYKPSTGHFWANSDLGADGGGTTDENEW